MASIKISHDGRGKARYIVNFQHEISGHGRNRVFLSLDEAAEFFYRVENSALGWRTVSISETRKGWTLQKLIYFFLGMQHSKLNRNAIKLTYYNKCRYELLAISGDILKKTITKISTRELELTINTGGLKWLRSGFAALKERGLIAENPIIPTKRHPQSPVNIPPKKAVSCLLNDYATRERIAFWLGAICGLRVGEMLALTYADVDQRYININKHTTPCGVMPGMKKGKQRRIRMPAGLFALLDHSKTGSSQVLVGHAKTGRPLTHAYIYSGSYAKAMKEQGVERAHDLRHFAVARLADRGVDILRVSKLIGHARPSITMDVYGHLFGDVADLDLE